jgi:hypothetical protein
VATPARSIEALNDTLNPKKSNTLIAPLTSQARSASPVGRLREAFKPAKRSSSAKPPSDSGSVLNQGNGGAAAGGGVGGLLSGRSRRASTSSRGDSRSDSRVFDDRPLVQEPGEATPSPKKPVPRPLITTTPPQSLNGPSTVVTPPTPTESSHNRMPSTPTAGDRSIADTVNQPIAVPESTHNRPAQGATHRRVKSAATNHPSKLSNSMPAPLTPAIEEVKTPGGSLSSPPGPGGFFSSMFSAAQNAATTLSSTITSGTSGPRSRSNTDELETQENGGGEEVILPPGSERQLGAAAGEKRQLAVETLGSGNLSLSHLGISENDINPMDSKVDVSSSVLRPDEVSAQAEDDAAAKAVSIAYSEKPNGEKTPSISPSVETSRQEDQTPSRALTEPESSSIKRTGSVRSRLSGRRRRTRGSSAATGTNITPVIAGPAGSTAQRLTGFAVANPKRNRDFHNLFRSVPDDDYLIEDYSAALQREILLHGRLYISEGHICFSSNILGWVTNLVMSFDEVISVEKRSTAVIFQNGLVISTMQNRNVFASLLNRDTTYELIISIWKITHPNLKSSLNGAPVETGNTGDKTEKAGSVIEDESASEEIYDEDEEDDDDQDDSFIEANDGSTFGSEAGEAATTLNRKVSAAVVGAPLSGGQAKAIDLLETAVTGAVATQDFPGPATHETTDCGDQASHHEKVLMDVVIPAPLGKIYSMMFGPASGIFMRKWLVEDQKSLDLQLEDDKQGLGAEKKTMTFSYIKPLGGSIGPKQTKCIITQTLEQFDLDKAVTVACLTQNPDVPSGNIFVVKTRYCLMWASGNATRIISTCTIEWSGKSWLKGEYTSETFNLRTH